MDLPPPRPLSKSQDPKWEPLSEKEEETNVPFVFVGNNAFPLLPNCLKPYSDKGLDDRKGIFNYRLSRFRRCSENGFGILSQVFGIFRTTINLTPRKVRDLVLAAITLHNMLWTKSVSYVDATNYIAEECNNETYLVPLTAQSVGNNLKKHAQEI